MQPYTKSKCIGYSFDGKLCIILFIVGDSGFETETGFSVIVLVGKTLKAKGSGNIISFELKIIFCSCSVCQWFQYFFKMLLEKSYPFSFALLTQASNFFSMTMSMFLF